MEKDFDKENEEMNEANEEMYSNMEKMEDDNEEIIKKKVEEESKEEKKEENDNIYQTEPQYQPYSKKKTVALVLIGITIAAVLIGVGLLVYFLVFDNKEESLSCSMTQSTSGVTAVSEINMNFKKGYFVNGTMSEKVDGSKLTTVQMNAVKETNLCADITNQGNEAVSFTNCKQAINGTDIIVSVDLVPGSTAQKEEVSIEEGKVMFEKMGFTCK